MIISTTCFVENVYKKQIISGAIISWSIFPSERFMSFLICRCDNKRLTLIGRQVSRFVNWMSVGVITSLSAVLLLLFYYLTHSSINIADGRTQGIIVVFIFRFLLVHLSYYQNELRVWFPKKLMQVLLYLYIVSVIYPVINNNSAHFICFWKLQVSHSQRKNFDQKQI